MNQEYTPSRIRERNQHTAIEVSCQMYEQPEEEDLSVSFSTDKKTQKGGKLIFVGSLETQRTPWRPSRRDRTASNCLCSKETFPLPVYTGLHYAGRIYH